MSTSLLIHHPSFSLIRAIISLTCLIGGAWLFLQGQDAHRSSATLYLLDNSLSLLVEDIVAEDHTIMSRLEKAKIIIHDSLQDGEIFGLITFTRSPVLVLPFSPTSQKTHAIISGIRAKEIGGGSDPFTALRFAKSLYGETFSHLTVRIITDGGFTSEDTPVDIPSGWSVEILPIGTLAGGRIPLGYNALGERRYKYGSGGEVIAKRENLRIEKLAHITHGSIRDSFPPKNLEEIQSKYQTILAIAMMVCSLFLHPFHQPKKNRANEDSHPLIAPSSSL